MCWATLGDEYLTGGKEGVGKGLFWGAESGTYRAATRFPWRSCIPRGTVWSASDLLPFGFLCFLMMYTPTSVPLMRIYITGEWNIGYQCHTVDIVASQVVQFTPLERVRIWMPNALFKRHVSVSHPGEPCVRHMIWLACDQDNPGSNVDVSVGSRRAAASRVFGHLISRTMVFPPWVQMSWYSTGPRLVGSLGSLSRRPIGLSGKLRWRGDIGNRDGGLVGSDIWTRATRRVSIKITIDYPLAPTSAAKTELFLLFSPGRWMARARASPPLTVN